MTMEELIAGLQNQRLRIPEKYRESLRRFTMTGQAESGDASGKNRDDIPFDRYVDIWWLALCVGIQEGRRTSVDGDNSYQSVRAGEVLPSNPWRLFQLQLIAISETGDTDILSKPTEIMNMANEYAATGFPIILDPLSGSEVPIWTVTTLLEERVGSR